LRRTPAGLAGVGDGIRHVATDHDVAGQSALHERVGFLILEEAAQLQGMFAQHRGGGQTAQFFHERVPGRAAQLAIEDDDAFPRMGNDLPGELARFRQFLLGPQALGDLALQLAGIAQIQHPRQNGNDRRHGRQRDAGRDQLEQAREPV
jgi:hypothetical protein